MKNIDLIAFKINAYDSDDFIKDLSSNGVSYIVLLFNPVSGYSIISNVVKNQKKPTKILTGISGERLSSKLHSIFFPITFFIDYLRITRKISQLVRRYSPENAFVDNTYFAFFFARLRKKSKINNLVYASHDWLGGENDSFKITNLFKYRLSSLFLICDYYACRNSDIVFNHTKILQQKRNNYWDDSFCKKEIYYRPHLTPLYNASDVLEFDISKNKIIFLGTATIDSGLELTLNAIKNDDYELNLIGMLNKTVKDMIKLDQNRKIKHLGYCSRSDFHKIFNSSIAGINLITSNKVHTVYTVPSKVMDYLRYGVPVVATKNIGIFAETIEEYGIGIVINPNKEEIISAFNQIKLNYKFYAKNIKRFFEEYPFSNIVDYLKLNQ